MTRKNRAAKNAGRKSVSCRPKSGSRNVRPLYDKHRVSKGKEPIFFPDRLTISVQYIFPSGKAADKHQKRRFRQMEICDQRVDRAEAVSGINKNSRPAGTRLHMSVFIGNGLQHSARRRPYGNDTAALRLGSIDRVAGLLRDRIIFVMHHMVFHIFFL